TAPPIARLHRDRLAAVRRERHLPRIRGVDGCNAPDAPDGTGRIADLDPVTDEPRADVSRAVGDQDRAGASGGSHANAEGGQFGCPQQIATAVVDRETSKYRGGSLDVHGSGATVV